MFLCTLQRLSNVSLVFPNASPRVRLHAHRRLTGRDIHHDLTETEKRGVNYIALGNLFCIRVRIDH